MTELSNLSLFVCALAKFLLMTGVGLGGAIALVAECCGFRVVALGFEKVSQPVSQPGSGGGQLANSIPVLLRATATSPPRKVRTA